MQFRTALFLTGVLFLAQSAHALPDIVFVTQPPNPRDFTTANSTFGSHLGTMDSIPRGGDLYIRYSDGTLKNLTAAAGFGAAGLQGTSGIAVRDPAVHWDGQKVIFSMVIGAPTKRYEVNTYNWQIYEITGLRRNETPVITKLPNQPASYNNVMPTYGSDDRVIFITDRPREGYSHTYPQRDEYESAATNSGLWSLDPSTGNLIQLDHAPSGDFSPSVDSYGRIIFTRWDHLQRDQQNRCSQVGFGAFNYSDESSNASALDTDQEVYPEPRGACEAQPNLNLDLHSFNHFLPWQINEDGTAMETINHIGRHELVGYIGKTFNNDPNIEESYGQYSRTNPNSIQNLLQLHEDPTVHGTYYGINAPEFGTHASGQIVNFHAPPGVPADAISVVYVTHPDTAAASDTPQPTHSGLSRDPVVLSDGTLIAAHTTATQQDQNLGPIEQPQSKYSYRLKSFSNTSGYSVPSSVLTSGIVKTVSFWSPDVLVEYQNATLWELQPQELVARARPTRLIAPLPAIEKGVFDEAGVTVEAFQEYLRNHALALIVSRNVTVRDNLDHQQPLNLKVANSTTQTVKSSGKIYEVANLQIFQGDLLRGYGGVNTSQIGRRVLARTLHSASNNIPNEGGPAGSIKIASDGSFAAFVPARRAITYQLTDSAGSGIVRERLWLTFQPGEIRVCTSCHGVNSKDQLGRGEPINKPEALRTLLDFWKSGNPGVQPDDGTPGSGGNPPEATPTPTPTVDVTPSVNVKLTTRAMQASTVSGRVSAPQILFKVKSLDRSGANKTFSVVTSVGDTQCPDVKTITTNRSGTFSATSKPLTLLPRQLRISYSLLLNGEAIAADSVLLRNSKPRALVVKRICKALQLSIR